MYWHYMDEDKSQTISFNEFWKGFKAQAQAIKAKALHQAQLELKRNHDYRYIHPYYWAPFILIGDWRR